MSDTSGRARAIPGPLMLDMVWVGLAFTVAGVFIESGVLMALGAAAALPLLWRITLLRGTEAKVLRYSAEWPSTRPFHVGETREVTLHVRNPTRGEVHLASIRLGASPWLNTRTLRLELTLGAGETKEIAFPVQARSFGLGRIHSATAEYTPAPGWIRVEERVGLPVRVTALPQPVDCPNSIALLATIPGRASEHVAETERRARHGMDLHSLEEHAAGDDARHLAWRASMRHRRLITRRFLAEADTATIVLVDNRVHVHSGAFGEAPLDRIVRVAWALAERLDRLGAQSSLRLVTEGSAAPVRAPHNAHFASIQTLLRARQPRCGPRDIHDRALQQELADLLFERGEPHPGSFEDALERLENRRGKRPESDAGRADLVNAWCLAEGAILRRVSEGSPPDSALEGILGSPGQARILLVTDLSRSPAEDPLLAHAKRSLQRGAAVEIIHCAPARVQHLPITDETRSRNLRVNACLSVEREARTADLVTTLRSQGFRIHEAGEEARTR